jgi:flagellin-like protein
MRVNIKKRGLSPVVATVLLILMVVVVVSMIFVWARGFFEDQTEGSERPVGELCSSVDFIANIVVGGLEIVNRGNVDIDGFEVKKSLNGLSEIEKINTGVLVGDSLIESTFTIDMEDGASTPESIEMFAVLKESSSENTFTCYSDPEFLVI